MSAAGASAPADGAASDFLSGVLEAVADVAVIATNQHGSITFFNRGAERLLGASAAVWLGQSAATLFRWSPGTPPPAGAADLSVFDSLCGRSTEPVSADCLGRMPDGGWCRLRLRVSGLWVAGEAVGHVCVATETSEVVDDQVRLQKIASNFPGVVYQYRLRPDGSSHFPFASEGMHRLYGVSPEEVYADATVVFSRLHRDDLPRIVQSLHVSAAQLTVWSCEHRIILPDGKTLWIDGRATPEREADGGTLWHGVLTDITERKVAEQALRTSEDRIELSLAGANLGLWDWDILRDRINFDARCAAMIGYPAARSFERTSEFSALVHPDDWPVLNAALESHCAGKTERFESEFRMRHQRGEWIWVLSKGRVTTRDDDGQAALLSGTHLDITLRREAERALRDSEAHFRQLFHDHDAVMLLVDPHSGTIADANPSAERFYGYPHDTMVGMALSQINLLGQEELADKYRSALGQEHNCFIFRHRLASSESRLVEVHASPVSRHGRMLLFSIIHDVTARRAAEHALHVLQQRLSAVIESFQGGVLVEDNQGRVLLANQGFCDLFALEQNPAELQGWDGRECTVAISDQFAAPDRFLGSTERALSCHRLVSGEQLAMADGRTLEREHVPILLDGAYSGPLWIYRDITQRKQQEQELFLLATTDALTGVANRRTFMLRLSEECARFRRYGVPASLLMLDIDHFKSVNDIHGHAAGDRVLKALVELCRQSLRTTDTLGRLGGEEFAVLLPVCPGKNAVDVAEALRLALLSHVLWHEGVQVQVTVSIGVAEFAADHADVESVLLMADRALYAAKQAGRNRVRLFSDRA
jgi:diguanylate cyclase (GGDEF)-like protein/PAS domain S-box-containing protein